MKYKTFKTIEEKREYNKKVMPKVLFLGGAWMISWAGLGNCINQDWIVIPMVFGFVGIVFYYYLIP